MANFAGDSNLSFSSSRPAQAQLPEPSQQDSGAWGQDLIDLDHSRRSFHGLPVHVHEMLAKASTQLGGQHRVSAAHQGAVELDTRPHPLAYRNHHGQPQVNRPFRTTNPMQAPQAGQVQSHPAIRYAGGSTTLTKGTGYSYAHAPRTQNGNQQSDPRRAVQMQVNYMESLALRVPDFSAANEESQIKERFRIVLVDLARQAVKSYGEQRGLEVGRKPVDLKCFGSLRNGFALPGADMDLVMTTNPRDIPAALVPECPHILAKAFLDAGIGARMLLRTRVPLIKVCEKPTDSLLQALKADYDRQTGAEVPIEMPNGDPAHTGQPSRASAAQPGGGRKTTELDFPKGVGVECDINFTGLLALHNTELLRCYALCDDRVRLVGLFVKMWAKARKINSPYHGTMCSYGYTLMVLHYMMNVVRPGIVPNLQIIYRPSQGCNKATTVDGCDVRFFNDESVIRAQAKANAVTANRQSVGDLLRGFFEYYSGTMGQGFHYGKQVVSIRTRGGILSKKEKGWTTWRTDENGVCHRYSLAVEDPFEINHNVGRTVNPAGLSAIRAEFRRAYHIIQYVQEIPGIGWEWREHDGRVGEDFLAERQIPSGPPRRRLNSVRGEVRNNRSRPQSPAVRKAQDLESDLKRLSIDQPGLASDHTATGPSRPQVENASHGPAGVETVHHQRHQFPQPFGSEHSPRSPFVGSSAKHLPTLIRPNQSDKIETGQTRIENFRQQTDARARKMQEILRSPPDGTSDKGPATVSRPVIQLDPRQFQSPEAITARPPGWKGDTAGSDRTSTTS